MHWLAIILYIIALGAASTEAMDLGVNYIKQAEQRVSQCSEC